MLYATGFKLPSVDKDYVEPEKVLRPEKDVVGFVVWGDDVGSLWLMN